ncbi:MAG: NAD(P)-dependent oxidoreductase [Bacteroidia bacterium]
MNSGSPILIVDDMHPALMKGLEDHAYSYSYLPEATREEVLAILPGYIGLVVRSKLLVDREVIEAGSQLRFIARAGSGMDNVDQDHAAAKGILCLNAPEGNSDAVGEHTAGLLLALTRNSFRAFDEVKEGLWLREQNRGEELTELTVGIIGYGHTGQAFARKISGFGCRVLFYDKFIKNIPTPFAQEALLKVVLDQADILSFHIPWNEENDGLINRALIEAVSRPFYLLNLSRGGIMKTKDVLWGLESGKIKAAALDVLENEKPGSWTPEERTYMKRFIQSKRVIVTPHIGGWTNASYRKISEVLLAKILPVLSKDEI